MSILYIYAESVQCLSKPKEDLKLQDCEWPDLGVGSCPQRSKEGIGPAGIGNFRWLRTTMWGLGIKPGRS